MNTTSLEKHYRIKIESNHNSQAIRRDCKSLWGTKPPTFG